MGDLSFSLNDLIWLGSFILMLSGIIKIFFSATRPIKDLQEKVEGHDNRLAEELQRLDEQEKATRIICKCMLALVDHEITGNGLDKLKAIKTELQEYLINK